MIDTTSRCALSARAGFARFVVLFALMMALVLSFQWDLRAQNMMMFRPMKRLLDQQAQGAQTSNSTSSAADSSHSGADTVQELASASTSRKSETEALQNIPWDAFDPQTRQAVENLLKTRSLYRRLPMAGGYCNPEVYDYLLTHPEIVVGIWRYLGYSQIDLQPVAPGYYQLSEQTGTEARAKVLFHNNRMILLYCAGIYHGAISLKPIEGEALVMLQYRFTEDVANDNRPLAISRLDCFIKIKNVGADIVGRTFAPLIGKIVDSNFVKTVDFVNSISESSEQHPMETAGSILKVDRVDRNILDGFAGILIRSAKLAELRASGEQVDYYLLPKFNEPQSLAARLLTRPNQEDTVRPAQVMNITSAANEGRPERSVSMSEVNPNRLPDEDGEIQTLKVYQVPADGQNYGTQTVIVVDASSQAARKSDFDPLRLYHEKSYHSSVRMDVTGSASTGSAMNGDDRPAMADLSHGPVEPLSLADDQTTAAKLTIRSMELPEDLTTESVELPAEEPTTEQPAFEEPVQPQFDLLTLPSD